MARAQRDKHVVARERIAELEKELEAVSTESENSGSGLQLPGLPPADPLT